MQDDYKILFDIQSEVLAYLDDHPNAADTADGIRQWWLFQRMALYSQDKVLKALDQLKDTGLLEARKLGDGREIFSLSESGKKRESSVVTTNQQEKTL